MKTARKRTIVTVKLRKSEYEELWYLYLDIYPFFENGSETPRRKKEMLGISISTPKWDRKKGSRKEKGAYSAKAQRDINGVILCRTPHDQEACRLADQKRIELQKKYDLEDLFADSSREEQALAEKQKCDFITYFEKITVLRNKMNSHSSSMTWARVGTLLKKFQEGKPLLFKQINVSKAEEFKRYLLEAPQGGNKEGVITQNTASHYFCIFLAALKQAFIDGYFTSDISAKIKGIPHNETRRQFLTMEEVNKLVKTECDNPTLKRAALFSILTGLRISDIAKLKWSELQKDGDKHRLNFTQQKTKGVEYMPISAQAYQLCGEPQAEDRIVFEGLPAKGCVSRDLKKWIASAGITKNITFHCLRHTYATLQCVNGTDIYTISKMLGHKSVKTTQIYAKIVDSAKETAANAIHIDNL